MSSKTLIEENPLPKKKQLSHFAKLGALDDLCADLAVAVGAEVLEEVAARLLHLAEAQTPSRHDSTSEV